MPLPENNAVVAQRMDVASGLMILRVTPKAWDVPAFKAGQYTVIGLPPSAPRAPFTDEEESLPSPDKLVRRAYSIASSSVENEYVEFYITLVRSGALTPRLFALAPGDGLWLSPKVVGLFTLDRVPEGHNLLLIATGTGIAPYMSMLRTHLADLSQPKIAVIHGARHSWDLGYHAELATMQRLCKNFSYVPIVSDPEGESVTWKGRVGFINEHWEKGNVRQSLGFDPSREHTHVFLCGNPLMIEAMLGILRGEGYAEHTAQAPGNIHLERFW
jgi:ferredoxin/flavodoxin---NADP+ reductase